MEEETWETIDRPGYFGSKRNEIEAGYDAKYSAGNWRIAWQWGDLPIPKAAAFQLYEDGYYEHFKNNPNVLTWLVSNFSNVFDTAPSNVDSGMVYDRQETLSNHIHDVAIRRAVFRRGKRFRGARLLQVRSNDSEGGVLSPCKVLFHLPDMMYRGEIKYQGAPRDFTTNPSWWRRIGVEDSIEEFYQSNKLLQVKIKLTEKI